jgi:Recombination endonuclease VII
MDIERTSKQCPKCHTEKPIEEFAKERRRPDGRACRCRPCARLARQEEYRRNLPKYKLRLSSCAPVDKLRNRKYKLWHKYRITPEDFDRILADQGNKCAICGTSNPRGKHGSFNVDHDHATGVVRGILCNTCNGSLGVFGDNIDGIMKVLEYLKRTHVA